MRLADSEVLFLECAEDFDIVDPSGGQTVQVKNSPADISLGSGHVKDAIENFWSLADKNAARGRLSLRYLTRGGTRFEKGRPFNPHKGIDYWRKAALGDDNACKRIAAHLKGRFASAELNTFLANASPIELREKLLGAIEWITEEPDEEAVRLAVERMAIQMGNARSIPAALSVSAVDGLLARCREAAKKGTPELRCLTREDLQLAFESKTHLPIPMTNSALALFSEAVLASQFGGHSVQGFSIAPALNELGLPALPHAHLPRSGFVGLISASIAKRTPVLIVGSEGRGKTTIANIVARTLTAECLWLDLSGLDELTMASALERVLVEVRRPTVKRSIVLDDLPVSEGLSQLVWTRVSALMEECKSRSYGLLMTAKGVHDGAVDSRFRSLRTAVHSVPDLSQSETESYFEFLGCSDAKQRKVWASMTLAQSGGGHPKLVHLRGLELQDLGWPAPTTTDLTRAPKSIEEARAHARKVAARTVPEPDRDFLYGLSLAALPFDRNVALALGAAMGTMSAPGEAFDRLVGRWVESLGRIGFKTTSLLAGQAAMVWPSARLCAIHCMLFDAFLSRKTIRIDEAFGIFVQALLSQDGQRLANYLTVLVMEKDEPMPGLFDNLAPILTIGRGTQSPAIPFDQRCSVMLKLLQFRVARERDPTMLPTIAEEWAWEISLLPAGERRDFSLLLRGFSVASVSKGDFSPKVLIQALEEFALHESIIKNHRGLIQIPDEFAVPGLEGQQDVVAMLFGVMHTRCKSVDFLEGLLTAVDQVDPTVRARMLRAFSIPFFGEHFLLVDNVWIAESKTPSPRWDRVVETMKRAAALGESWRCRELSISAIRVLSILFDEYLNGEAESINVLHEAKQRFGDSPVLIAQEANILFRRSDYQEALRLWRGSLDNGSEQSKGLIRDPFSLRKAGIAAGQLGLYNEAAQWFQRASQMAKETHLAATAAGFQFDAAYCWFKAGRCAEAISAAANGLISVKGHFDPESEFQWFATQKLGGHVILWLLEQVKAGRAKDQHEPLLGQCSSPDKHEDLKTLPASRFEISAVMLMQLASYLAVNDLALETMRPEIESSKITTVSIMYWSLKTEEAMASAHFEDLATCLYEMQKSYWRGVAHRRVGGNVLEPFDGEPDDQDRVNIIGLDSIFLSAALIQSLTAANTGNLWIAWDLALQNLPDAESFRASIDRAKTAFYVDGSDARAIMASGDEAALPKLGAAARILVEPGRSPFDTARSQMAVLTWLLQSSARFVLEESLDLFANAFVHQWPEHIASPALLRNPRLSVSALAQAIRTEGTGASRLLKLVDAASMASGVIPPSLLLNELRRIECDQKMRISSTQ
jgi:tetratricopeptide (TPR) repeat protein